MFPKKRFCRIKYPLQIVTFQADDRGTSPTAGSRRKTRGLAAFIKKKRPAVGYFIGYSLREKPEEDCQAKSQRNMWGWGSGEEGRIHNNGHLKASDDCCLFCFQQSATAQDFSSSAEASAEKRFPGRISAFVISATRADASNKVDSSRLWTFTWRYLFESIFICL